MNKFDVPMACDFSESFENVDVVILAGGLGSRVSAALGDTPKILAPVRSATFFDEMVSWLQTFGVKRIILCLGHLSKKIISHVSAKTFTNLSVVFAEEAEPLGTAGAVRNACHLIREKTVLVMNGDTWVDANLSEFLKEHREYNAEISLLCVNMNDASRYASVDFGQDHVVLNYREKNANNRGPGIISAGMYLFSDMGFKRLIRSKGPSIEFDFLQKLPMGAVYGFSAGATNFIDLGTPSSLNNLESIMPNYYKQY